MKIRNGFVSNSSSSSFILHKSEVTNEQWKNLLKELQNLKEELSNDEVLIIDEWGESGRTFDYCGNYLIIETNRVYDHFSKIIKKLNISESCFFDVDY